MQTELFVHNNDHGVSKQISADIEQSVGSCIRVPQGPF